MIGTFRWNLLAGTVGFIGTLLASFHSNVWSTVLIHSIYSFLILFLFTFVVRWVLNVLILSSGTGSRPILESHESDGIRKGQSIDLSTPDDVGLPLNGDSGQGDQMEFTPLNPPKLTTKLDNNPQELANALRRMTDE